MKKLSVKTQLILFLFCFLAFIAYQEQSQAVVINGLIAVVFSVLTDDLFGFMRSRKWKISESAAITGLLIGFVLSAGGTWWSYPLAATIAILSKHLIRFKGKHIFNPAGFGALFALLFLGSSTQWYGAYIWYIIIPFGLYFVWRFKRLTTVAAFYLSAVVLYGVQSYVQKVSFLDAMIYINHFFVLIMLIEPKTSPLDKIGMIGYGVLASAFCFGLSFVSLPWSAELPVLLGVNFVNFLYQQIRGRKP